MNQTVEGFLLTRDWRDSRTGLHLDLWLHTDAGALPLRVPRQESVCFFAREQLPQLNNILRAETNWRQQPVDMCLPNGGQVNALYCKQQRIARELIAKLTQAGVTTWETDIRPADRYLMERFVTADLRAEISTPHRGVYELTKIAAVDAIVMPNFRVLSLDIETSFDGQQLFSIAVQGCGVNRVYMIADQPQPIAELDFELHWCISERECLRQFLRAIEELDPDILIGWSLVQFDLWMLKLFCERNAVAFSLGRAKAEPRWRQDRDDGDRKYINLAGRVALDGIELLKTAFYRFDSYSLQAVSEQILGDSKLLVGGDKVAEIMHLFAHDKVALARYNLHDCQLVSDIFSQLKLIDFAVARSRLTGLPLDRAGGSVAAFEYAYLPLLHRAGFVAPNLGELDSDIVSPGGYVMESEPGFYQDVLVLDFKSLYPSIIRSFLIDPCGFWTAQLQQLSGEQVVEGFNGARFAKAGHLLPGIIEKLWRARDKAKRDGNSPLSQAIKIIMNSFYGVLGSTGCRFFDPRVCSSITLRGHEIIQRSKLWIEQQGYQVIYGDTDSLFVWVEQRPQAQTAADVGSALAAGLNDWWNDAIATEYGAVSALEIEFETHFEKFFMPTIRGSELGSKKRYAGMISDVHGQPQLIFKGLESVRTDWTPLARKFQQALYWKLFQGEPFAEWVQQQVADLLAGRSDGLLIYRKRLRRHLRDYQKNRPPHVQAGLKMAAQGKAPKRGDWVEYLITVSGPEPVAAQKSAIDYQHYLQRQLLPVADAILPHFGSSFQQLTDDQMTLFGGEQ